MEYYGKSVKKTNRAFHYVLYYCATEEKWLRLLCPRPLIIIPGWQLSIKTRCSGGVYKRQRLETHFLFR